MNNSKLIKTVLRIGIAGEFVGHGMFALGGRQQWAGWITTMIGVSSGTATQLLFMIGLLDLLVALIVLIRPIRLVLLWAVFWGFWTALLRPLVGESFWDFIERWSNWGAPLALLLLIGWPKNLKELFR